MSLYLLTVGSKKNYSQSYRINFFFSEYKENINRIMNEYRNIIIPINKKEAGKNKKKKNYLFFPIILIVLPSVFQILLPLV